MPAEACRLGDRRHWELEGIDNGGMHLSQALKLTQETDPPLNVRQTARALAMKNCQEIKGGKPLNWGGGGYNFAFLSSLRMLPCTS